MLIVVFGVWFLNVFGFVLGCVISSVLGSCVVVFGVRFRCCVVFERGFMMIHHVCFWHDISS